MMPNPTTIVRHTFFLAVFVVALNGIAVCEEIALQKTDVLSRPYLIDKRYRSMEGPGGAQDFTLSNGIEQELLWITGGRVGLRSEGPFADDKKAMICHANLRVEQGASRGRVKLFSFVDGQPEIRLPDGFGIPVWSTRTFEFNFGTMNPGEPKDPFRVRAAAEFYHIKDSELTAPMKPLFMVPFVMRLEIREGEEHPANCPMVEAAELPKNVINQNEKGYRQAYHWMVPPGRHEYRYEMERSFLSGLPFDTTIHYVNAHLHPHAESIELRDLTEQRTILKITVKNNADRTGIVGLDEFKSAEGALFVREHQYEMVVDYNNTTDHPVDAMALLFVYFRDKAFQKESSRS